MPSKSRRLVKVKKPITLERVKELLRYEPETGLFYRLKKMNNNGAGAGESVGTLSVHGYRKVQIDCGVYLLHRLAHLYMTGEWPPHEIDHINGVRTDNRWCNLRPVSDSQNRMNVRETYRENALLGVCETKNGKRWRANICPPGGKSKHIGTFDTAEEAHTAYIAAKRVMHSHCTI